ncbi:MAG: hypothetical protein JXR76_22030 [Deltaproteobacteria bacterium]|nr:hypothetical protein [Deltaproteobacteria bacterium]
MANKGITSLKRKCGLLLKRSVLPIMKYFGVGRYDYLGERDESIDLWRCQFPEQAGMVIEYLCILDDVFLVPDRFRNRILPDDTIGRLYHTSADFVDSYEIENIYWDIEKHFHKKLTWDTITPEMTMAELFHILKQ